MRIIWLTCCFLASLLWISGCGDAGAPDSGPADAPVSDRPQPVMYDPVDGHPPAFALAADQVLHRGNGEEPQTLDPHLSEGIPSAHILRDLFEGLVAEAADGQLIPGVAEHWEVSDDGLRYTFSLREDARWSNGDSVTAADFVAGLRRSADPETASGYAQILSPIENASAVTAGELPVSELGVEALDPGTLEIRLGSPTPYLPGLLTHSATYPIHQPSLAEYGREFTRPGNLVSNGAFVLTDWRVRARIVLEKNPYYWDADDVLLEKVIYYPIEDQGTELKRYRAGELDWTYEVPDTQFAWLQTHLPDELTVTPWLGTYFFGYNLQRPPFENELGLRQALAMVIDRELLTERVTRFGERPTLSLVPPGLGQYQPASPRWAELGPEERLTEARRLYADAGYTADDPLRVELRYNTSDNHKKIALAIAAMWKQNLGVVTTLINEEWKVFLQNRAQKSVTEVFRAGWISDFNDPYSFLELFHSSHGRNDSGYDNPSYDRLLARIAEEAIPARRRRLMQEAERMLLADQPIIPVFNYMTKRLVSPLVGGWQPNIMDHHPSRHLFLLAERRAEADKPAVSQDATPGDRDG